MSPWITAPILVIAVNVLWQIGGQFYKAARRFGVPIVGALYMISANHENKELDKGKKPLRLTVVFGALTALLCAGYGEDSILKKLCGGREWLTRLAMAALIASVFAGYSVSMHHVGPGIPVTYVLNIAAWQIRAGSLCRIWKFDILIEDICRATALAVSMILA
jgi:hypothetical protein